MDMDMGDMDHEIPGIGMDTNHAFVRGYWYTIAGVVVVLTAVRGVNYFDARRRLKSCRDASVEHPTRPQGPVSQAWATATAIVRETSHPQLYVPIKGLRWLTPPSLGRIIVLCCYWAVMVYLMSWRVSKNDVYYYERIGYRNAWLTIGQLPLLFLLAMKVNVIGFLIGTSHERLNWLHRWVGRTMFVTATLHGWHFWTMWVKADFVEFELQIMPLIKYGIGAWGILLWTFIIGFLPIRRLAYEVWVIQHVLSFVLILWLVSKHLPNNDARYLIWMSISFLAFDRVARWFLLLWQNIKLRPNGSTKHIGHEMSVRAVCPSTTVVTIKDARFKWAAGQHIYLWVPRLGPVEAHPYTIACAEKRGDDCNCDSIQLVVRAHNGFSKRLHEYAMKNPESTLTGFVSGPYGIPPRWDIYETMVLIGASTGASFTLPILERITNDRATNCARRIELVLIARTAQELKYYVERAEKAGRNATARGVRVTIHVAITGGSQGGQDVPSFAKVISQSDSESGRNSPSELKLDEKTGGGCCCSGRQPTEKTSPCRCRANSYNSTSEADGPELIREYTSRPNIDALIRSPVEEAWGETAVVVCGGPEIVARTRNTVSRLSDERAVHKGTGAQGILLHVEEYSF
ncbi:hypothetical protein BGZ63DRAFT_103541 [Mariannaea sp. PMI_226]|nr:hypothetical protein BGZ63DRAFT_103541 [Mariannaea sp. PMI_226]